MATVQAFIRTSTKKVEKVNIRFRLRDGRSVQLFHKSELEVNPDIWDAEKQAIKARIVYKEDERQEFNTSIATRKDVVIRAYSALSEEEINSERLEEEIDKILHPEKYKSEDDKPATLFQYIDKFIELSPQRQDKATGRLLTYNNIQQYKATDKHLRAFAEIKKRNDFAFEDINQKFYDEFTAYLQNRIIEEYNIEAEN